MPAAEILSLPWATVIFLASGYMGYFVANAGTREHHQQIDVIFSTAVYGFFSLFAYQIALSYDFSKLSASLPAVLTGVLMGAVWTATGRHFFEWLFHRSGVSYNNDTPTAWMQILRTRRVVVQQITVTLKNGWQLHCEDLHRFAKAPNGPCCLGAKGDVLLYVTHRRPAIGDDWQQMNDVAGGEGWGPTSTWIAADEISLIELGRSTVSASVEKEPER